MRINLERFIRKLQIYKIAEIHTCIERLVYVNWRGKGLCYSIGVIISTVKSKLELEEAEPVSARITAIINGIKYKNQTHTGYI